MILLSSGCFLLSLQIVFICALDFGGNIFSHTIYCYAEKVSMQNMAQRSSKGQMPSELGQEGKAFAGGGQEVILSAGLSHSGTSGGLSSHRTNGQA